MRDGLAQIASVRFFIKLWNSFFLCVFVGACSLVIAADVVISLLVAATERFVAIIVDLTIMRQVIADILLEISAVLSVLGVKVNNVRPHDILIELSDA